MKTTAVQRNFPLPIGTKLRFPCFYDGKEINSTIRMNKIQATAGAP